MLSLKCLCSDKTLQEKELIVEMAGSSFTPQSQSPTCSTPSQAVATPRDTPEPPKKRRRGRPRKRPPSEEEEEQQHSPVHVDTLLQHRRRRPPRKREKESDSEEEYLPSVALFEYQWVVGDGEVEWYMLQEHVAEFLDIRGMQRKYPGR